MADKPFKPGGGNVAGRPIYCDEWEVRVMPRMPIDIEDFNPNNPHTALALLGMEVGNLRKEKDALVRELNQEQADRRSLEKRVADLEGYFQRGRGIIYVLMFAGGVVGFLAAYWKTIFAPWYGKP